MEINYSELQERIKAYVGQQYLINIEAAQYKAQIKIERELMEGALVLSQYPEEDWVDELCYRGISKSMIPAIKGWIIENLENLM